MSEFEFVLIPVGIVIGIALANALQSWGIIIQQPNGVAKSALFMSATAMVMTVVLMNFSGLWAYSDVAFAFPNGAPVLLIPLLLILPIMALLLSISILIPHNITGVLDFNSRYHQVSRRFFLVFGVAQLLSLVPDFLPGVSWTPSLIEIIVPLALIFALAFF